MTTKVGFLILVGLLALAGAILFGSYQITSEMALARADAASPDGKAEAGRYVLNISGGTATLLDSATGASWVLASNGWVKAPTTLPTEMDNDVYDLLKGNRRR